jgi:ABC-type uncharacterized transport system permease subunit
MFGREIPKQRGIYSEILTTEDTENIKVSIKYSFFSHSLYFICLFYFVWHFIADGVDFWSRQKVSLQGQR